MKLVIVESPTKAKTIIKFLTSDYKVESSFGHIRDLPKSKMGIDIDNGFVPKYVIPRASRKTVNKLKKEAQNADTIILATDEDREGEAIAWHIMQALDLKPQNIQRIAFHEITKESIQNALKNPRKIELNLVNAQQARRILDRLVGYELSPFLWKKVAKGLSAGRVQSVAVRLIVEREREIQAFKAQEYWTIKGVFYKEDKKADTFQAKLNQIDGKVLDKFAIPNESEAKKIVQDLEKRTYIIFNIRKKEIKRKPNAPFTTSTLQQEANNKFGFSAKQTMRIAQQLYEGIDLGSAGSYGLITYMRTDSVNLADKFLSETKEYLEQTFGNMYSNTAPRKYTTKSKTAQEAHEAIRPTDIHRTPESIKKFLNSQQLKLYTLIYNRALASQMPDALIDNTTVDITTEKDANKKSYQFRATGNTIKFDGFLKIYPDSVKESLLPELKEKQKLYCEKLLPTQHFTQPPARYSDASLVKALEENGIGRPSTYAPTISTIIERGYVEREERHLKPTDIAFLVNDLLTKHFPKIVDYKFTAEMETDLDEIAKGKREWQSTIKKFYKPFKNNLMQKYQDISKKELTEEKTNEKCEKCGKEMVIKIGRFGKFLACTGFPECKNTKPINKNNEVEEPKLIDEKCPECGSQLQIKNSRYGQFYGCSNYPDCRFIKNHNESTGVKCPNCQKGDIVVKRSRTGKTFFACDQYPACKYALWNKPTGEKCEECESLMVYTTKNKTECSNKECKTKNQ